MEYSKRTIDIIETLLGVEAFTTISEIADQLGVSRRTVFREMEDVERLVTSLGMALLKKPRIGVKLEANETQRDHFEKEYIHKVASHYDQEMRQQILIVELLKSKEPQKFYYFANMLGVSEATISYDMDKIEPWFVQRDIVLVRKPGFGVYLEGSESSFRKAIVDFLYTNYEHQELITLMETGLNPENMVDALIEREILIKVTQILNQFDEVIAKKLTDAAYMGLLIHLSIAVQRTMRGERIIMNGELLGSLKHDAHYEIASRIGESVENRFQLKFPEDELGYITMHLKGSKLKTSALVDENDIMISNYEISRLASKMITFFKEESGYNLKDDEKLLYGLVSHLRPALTRMKLRLDIRNPLLDKIIEMYPEIFELSKETCQILAKTFDVHVPDEEVGYVAMHFGAAIERFRKVQQTQRELSVGVVCSSGVGTSSLLSSRLLKLFPKLNLVSQFSKEDILMGRAEENHVDLLISTIAIEHALIPVVIVNPLVLEEDETRIRQVIGIIGPRTMATHPEKPTEIRSDNIKIKWLHDITESILDLDSTFILETAFEAKNMGGVIKKISEYYTTTFVDKRKLTHQFESREKMGSTIIHEEGIMLLHTKSQVFSNVRFGIWRLKTPLETVHDKKVHTIIVMGMPSPQEKYQAELMSQISKAIVENEAFVNTILTGDAISIKTALNDILQSWLGKRLQQGGGYDR